MKPEEREFEMTTSSEAAAAARDRPVLFIPKPWVPWQQARARAPIHAPAPDFTPSWRQNRYDELCRDADWLSDLPFEALTAGPVRLLYDPGCSQDRSFLSEPPKRYVGVGRRAAYVVFECPLDGPGDSITVWLHRPISGDGAEDPERVLFQFDFSYAKLTKDLLFHLAHLTPPARPAVEAYRNLMRRNRDLALSAIARYEVGEDGPFLPDYSLDASVAELVSDRPVLERRLLREDEMPFGSVWYAIVPGGVLVTHWSVAWISTVFLSAVGPRVRLEDMPTSWVEAVSNVVFRPLDETRVPSLDAAFWSRSDASYSQAETDIAIGHALEAAGILGRDR